MSSQLNFEFKESKYSVEDLANAASGYEPRRSFTDIVDLTSDDEPATQPVDWDADSQETQPYEASQEMTDPEPRNAPDEDDNEEEEDAPPAKRNKLGKPARIGNAKNWLLTYPNLTYEQANKHAIAKNIDKYFNGEEQYCVIARENHKNGIPHIHIFIQFRKKKQFRSIGVLDALIPGGKHGNYKAARHPDAARAYVMKCKNYLETGNYAVENPWKEAIEAKSVDAGMEVLKAHKCRDFVLFSDKIEQTLKRLHPVAATASYVQRSGLKPWILPDELTRWVQDELPKKGDRALALVLVGDSRTGKTTWARSLVPENHNYFRGEFSLNHFRDAAALNVFDDCASISGKSRHYRKQLLTCMGESFLTDKYTKKVKVNISQPSIVLVNTSEEVAWCTDSESGEYAYWQKNAIVVILENNLY